MLQKIVLSLWLTFFTATCYGASFNHFAWGTSANNIQDIVYLGCDLNATFYQPVRLPENIQIGNLVLPPQTVQYTFWDNQLGRVFMSFTIVNKSMIYDELAKTFGKPDIKAYPAVKKYVWKSKPTIIIFNISPSACSIEYLSYDIYQKQLKLESIDLDNTL